MTFFSMVKLKSVLALAFALASPIALNAVTAVPGIIHFAQPDGSVVDIELKGDERFNWAVSADGYTLMPDNQGFYNYASVSPEGELAPSGLILGKASSADLFRKGITPGLFFPRTQIDKSIASRNKARLFSPSAVQVDASFPSIGKRKLLMLLVNYSDTKTTYTQADFDNYMNQEGFNGSGSFRDYYLENSYGQLDIATTVTRWVTLPKTKAYYGSERVIEMIVDALAELGSEVNLSEFDNDHDGVLDGLAVIHQGTGQEASGSTSDIWSHSSVIYGYERDGIKLRRYTIQPEVLATTNKISTIGVMCHEFGHNLGAPDFYDTDYSGSGGEFPGTGVWDIMGSGAWNGTYGDCPAGTNMWQKIQLGWVEPKLLTETCDVTDMPGATFQPVAYRFETTVPGEYFILENRQCEGEFDGQLPGHGMLVYHVSEERIALKINENEVNAAYPQGMYLVAANATVDPTPESPVYGYIDGSGAPFPGTTDQQLFSDNSFPSTKSISGRNSYKALSKITESDNGKISFHFEAEAAPLSPANLRGTAVEGNVILEWDSPAKDQALEFTVYRNGKKIATTDKTEFVDRSPSSTGNINYFVDATYPSGLISPYSKVTIRIPSNKVESVVASCGGDGVRLTLGLNSRLSRMESDIDKGAVQLEHMADEVDYVHRFRVDDLKVYRGHTIKRVAFIPMQTSKEATFTIRVWEAEADGSNPTVVSERTLKEFGAFTWNQSLLTKAVEITGDKEIWIGVNVKSTVGSVSLLTDVDDAIQGYGNLIRKDNGSWETDSKASGNYMVYGVLSAPKVMDPDALTAVPDVNDADIDFLFPCAFNIYRDGELLGATRSVSFFDNKVAEGTHTYAVSSLYPGGSETARVETEVEFNPTVVNDLYGENSSLEIVADNGEIRIANYDGHLTIVNLLGRILFDGVYHRGSILAVGSGVVIVKTSNLCAKVMVR